ncbi:hypothetical protein [Asaia spathodeae]|uniref:Uncharacterized protein n=1 Tax=Asaia spathodeae TaxID=657016 RepID=A0ABX2P941_9PROT|nr:hypothetical protein [Asaia spathodeae]GBR15732.1 hypothetical protein AA105894_1403 [Asaia spathodeae NBRC 105894]
MLRFLLALAALVVAPMEIAFAGAAPSHFSAALSRQISSDGPRAVAWRLTLNHNWSRVVSDVATNDPALSSATLRALLDYTPRYEKASMQQALRERLQKDTLAGLAALSPVSHSPYSGRAICGAGEARWKHQLQPALLATHDIVYALQREDCLKALRLHS